MQTERPATPRDRRPVRRRDLPAAISSGPAGSGPSRCWARRPVRLFRCAGTMSGPISSWRGNQRSGGQRQVGAVDRLFQLGQGVPDAGADFRLVEAGGDQGNQIAQYGPGTRGPGLDFLQKRVQLCREHGVRERFGREFDRDGGGDTGGSEAQGPCPCGNCTSCLS